MWKYTFYKEQQIIEPKCLRNYMRLAENTSHE